MRVRGHSAIMPGIRITLDRERMPVFVQHPLPWEQFYWPPNMQYVVVYDAHNKTVPGFTGHSSGDTLWDVYQYVTAAVPADNLPHIFMEYSLPWIVHEWVAYNGQWLTIQSANMRSVFSGAPPRASVLHDLSQLAYLRYSGRR